MSPIEKQELIDRISAMSEEELNIVAEVIPVQCCLKRLVHELSRAQVLADQIARAVDIYEKHL